MGRVTGELRASMDDATMDKARSRVTRKDAKGNMIDKSSNLRIIPDIEGLYILARADGLNALAQDTENVYQANLIMYMEPKGREWQDVRAIFYARPKCRTINYLTVCMRKQYVHRGRGSTVYSWTKSGVTRKYLIFMGSTH